MRGGGGGARVRGWGGGRDWVRGSECDCVERVNPIRPLGGSELEPGAESGRAELRGEPAPVCDRCKDKKPSPRKVR